MSGFSRFLLYETNTKSQYVDYGEVVQIINEKSINVNIGGERDSTGNLLILEAVTVEGNYIPKIGDWVSIDWRNGQPIAIGGDNSGMSSGLTNINNNVKIISQNDVASGVVNSDHIRANTIEARHITAQAIKAEHISANTIVSNHISAGSITGDKISGNTITGDKISGNTITGDKIVANAITAVHISANAITGDKISGNTITGDKIMGNQISGNHIAAGSIDAGKLTVSARVQGLIGNYYTFSGNPSNKFETFKGSRVDQTINLDWASGSPSIVGQNDNFAIMWQGFIFTPEVGNYTFAVKADEGAKVWIDNTLVVDAWTGSSGVEKTGVINLSKDQWYSIRIDYYETTSNASIYVKWKTPSNFGAAVDIPAMYLTQAQTIIDGGQIITSSITATAIKAGTITAESGIIGDAAITNANIQNAAITNAKIGNAEIRTAHIQTGNITTALIKDAAITDAKIAYLDAGKIQTGFLSADLIAAGTITGVMISGSSITGDKIAAGSIDSNQIKAGAITSMKIAAGTITGDKIAAGSITGENIIAGSIAAEHITTKGLDANIVNVYNAETGQVLIGGGYLRVDGLDVGVVQSDNLIGNGLFLTASSAYGLKRDNEAGEAILGSVTNIPGAHEIWKIDTATGAKVNALAIPAKKPVDIAIDTDGTYAYATVQGDDTMVQIDLANFALTQKSKKMGKGPTRIMYTGDALQDMKHFFILNTDPSDNNIPDSIIVVDAPPTSVDSELYVHHWMEVGNTPYDMILDAGKILYVTQAGQGDIAVIDVSDHNSLKWKVKGTIPIAAYMTDNYHGGLQGFFGLDVAVGGDASSAYDQSNSGDASTEHGGHVHSGYGSPSGALKEYTPHGIAQSLDADTLYVCDFKNNELVVVDKYGKAPYNELTGLHTSGNMGGMEHSMFGMEEDGINMFMMDIGDSSHDEHGGGESHGNSPASAMWSEGGGPTTRYVRYRIPVGNAPDFVTTANGKVFVSLQGTGQIAVIDEADIVNEIELDRAFYGPMGYQDPFSPMRDLPEFNIRFINVGSKPARMIANGGVLFAVLSGQNQVVRIDIATETILSRINVGPNPKGITLSNDGAHIYCVNHGGSGDLSFVYPKGPYFGDAFIGLEGGINLQGADYWIPDRSNWVYDGSGNLRSYSTIEFRINEPFLNEGGYVRMALVGKDVQYTQIEQDVYTVINYSNGSNLIEAVDEVLSPLTYGTGNNIFGPKNPWIDTPLPQIRISGNGTVFTPSANTYTIAYGDSASIVFSGGIVPSGAAVLASYTARHNMYWKPHNGSILVAVENGSSQNFKTEFEIDEFVPKFVVFDNQQTDKFTPIADGINEEYTGLEYSYMTNRAKGMTVTSSATPVSANSLIMNFKGKTAGVTSVTPHIAKVTGAASLVALTGSWTEISSAGYSQITTIDGTTYSSSTSTNGNMTQQIFSFDLIQVVESRHGEIPVSGTAAKVSWLKTNVKKITANWWGRGSNQTGNKATLNMWKTTTSSWVAYGGTDGFSPSHTSSTIARATIGLGASSFEVIDSNGLAHLVAYAEASNGTVQSALITDYVELVVDVAMPKLSTSLSTVTDGTQITEQHGDHTDMTMFPEQPYITLPSGNQYVTVDLGKKYMVGQLAICHMFERFDRIYRNTKTQVSEDGTTWTTVYDSAVSGEYNEKPMYHPVHGHTHYAKMITFPAKPVRYIRDYANGWVSGDGLVSGNESHWTEIKAMGDWEVEEDYFYPAGSEFAGQQMATNGKCVVTTDIQDAYIAFDMQIEFTSWWFMTYLVGPEFGRLKVDMSSMAGSHFLSLDAPYLNKIAHRHIMPFTPSINIKENPTTGVKAGKHRTTIKQVSGKVSIDRFRIEDFQYYQRNSLPIANHTTSNFKREKIVAQQAKWYVGMGRQATEGAYDNPRVNPDTGLPDNSVPIKYRFRVKSTLSANGTVEERGIAYVTSAIFETGKLHTHWRRSESVDFLPANKLQPWDANQPHSTGIQHTHLANGSVRGTKILPHAIMDYHISPYARIEEFKLALKHPTHRHGRMIIIPGAGPMGTDLPVFESNKDFLDSLIGFSGISGNHGTGNTVARGDHNHDARYLLISGGGTINGNLVVTGTINGFNISTINSTISNHIGSGGTAHALVVSSGNAGFISGVDKAKLDAIQINAINQATADGRYLLISGGTARSLTVDNTENIPFKLRRLFTDTEFVTYKISDGTFDVLYTNDEAASSIVWTLNNTDTETGGGVNANNGFVKITQDKPTGTKLFVGNNIVWHSGNFVPSQYATLASMNGAFANYYTKSQTYSNTEIDAKVAASGDIRAASANVFTNTNTFSNAGLQLNLKPSANVAGATKLFLVSSYTAADLMWIDASGNVTIKGNLYVSGSTVSESATTTTGDQTFIGSVTVSGNTNLGGVSTDVTTVKGSFVLASGTAFKQVGVYNEVHRRPMFGLAGDMLFTIEDMTSFVTINTNYDLSAYAMPPVANGATRYYRLYFVYSDNVTGPQGTAGQKTTIRISGNTTAKDFDLINSWGDPYHGRRDMFSPYFADMPAGNIVTMAKMAQTGNIFSLRWVELVAYDRY